MRTIDGVIFDMDGVLCDSEPFIREAAIRMLATRYHVDVAADDFLPFVGMGEDRYLGGVAERYGLRLTMPGDKELTYRIYLDLIRGRLHPLSGVTAFIAACRERGCALTVATSADAVKMNGNLREIGLPKKTFDACVHGGEVRRRKPFPDLFQLAARRANVDAARCLVVEDAPAGIEAARAAGALALGVQSSFSAEALLAAGATWTTVDLADAVSRLDRMIPDRRPGADPV